MPSPAPPRVGPPTTHQLALMIWLCVFPTLTVINLALGDWLGTLSPVLRTFVLATVAVPIVIYGLMPQLHKVRARLVEPVRRALTSSRPGPDLRRPAHPLRGKRRETTPIRRGSGSSLGVSRGLGCGAVGWGAWGSGWGAVVGGEWLGGSGVRAAGVTAGQRSIEFIRTMQFLALASAVPSIFREHPLTIRPNLRLLATVALASVGVVGLAATPAEASSPLRITRVYVNSPGPDRGSNASLNAEYVRIKNTGRTSRSLKGYTVRDESNHVYRFSSFTLKAGSTVTVRTGRGSNTSRTRYMNRSWYVWNNSGGDSATLRDAGGARIDTCRWRTVSADTTC